MFRILQTLEREPQEDLSNQLYDTSPAPGRTPFVRIFTFYVINSVKLLCCRYGICRIVKPASISMIVELIEMHIFKHIGGSLPL